MRGFTIIELLIVIAIIAIISGVVLTGFRNYQLSRALELSVKETRQMFEEARSLTLASVNDSAYGVRVELDKVTLFAGDDFDPSDPDNEVFIFDHRVIMSEMSFDPVTSVIRFERGTGEVNTEGFMELSLINRPDSKKRIIISKQGIISSNE